MKLPFLISVPHAGIKIPAEVQSLCELTERQIVEDGDEGAAEIYDLRDEATAFVTTDIARAIIDLNRPEDDRRADGVVKTHTIWNIPVYSRALPENLIEILLEKYYRPYHGLLSKLSGKALIGIDCHTMAEFGPPIGPDTGQERPKICISNAKSSCPDSWLEMLAECLNKDFHDDVSINEPFKGGFIIRKHAGEIPWLQLEISRAPFMSNSEKRERLLVSLGRWCNRIK